MPIRTLFFLLLFIGLGTEVDVFKEKILVTGRLVLANTSSYIVCMIISSV